MNAYSLFVQLYGYYVEPASLTSLTVATIFRGVCLAVRTAGPQLSFQSSKQERP